MRPGRLTLQAFGPYAEPQAVDFDALRDDGLFLIHGATGSGKTFLLDALSFALYGEVAGGRSVASLRSDHAAAAAEPVVTLEFDAQGDRWLVERVPAHQRLGLRAATLVDKPARAALSRRVTGRWVPEVSGVKEVGLRIGELIGLTAKQFRQVILLPQGRFQEVLLATSDTREELLKTLFDSVLFESVSLHLDRRARDAADTLDGTGRDLEHLRRQAAERWTEVTGTEGTGAEAGAGDDAGDGPSPIDDQDGLDRLAARATACAAARTADAERAEHLATDAEGAAAAARATTERYRRRNELLAEQAALQAGAAAADIARARLTRADAAARTLPALERLADAERDDDAARSQLRSGTEQLASAIAGAAAPVPGEVIGLLDARSAPTVGSGAGPDATGAAHDALTVRQALLVELADLDERRSTLIARAGAAEREGDELAHAVERARFELAGLTATEDALRARLREADDAAAQLDGLEAAAQALAAQARAAALLGDADAALERSRRAHADAEAQLRATRARAANRRAAHLDGIAAVLAGHLAEGDACLVCGATEHPRPAATGPDSVSAEEVAAADAALDAAHLAERAAAAEVGRAETARITLRHDAGLAAADPDGAIERAAAAIARVSATAATAATGGDLLDQLDTLADRRAALTDQIDTDGPRSATARRDASALRLQADEDADRLQDAVGDAGVARARDEVRRLLATVGELRDASTRTVRAAADLASARADADRAVERSTFADHDDARRAVLDDADRAALERQVAHHDQRLLAIRAQLGLPELADLPLLAPPVDDLEHGAAAAWADARTAADDRARWTAGAAAIAALADRHRAAEQSFRAERERAEVLVRVADQCMGRVGDKVSLQRWVLATYLEEICELATARLQTMTSHRYSLRVHRERAARGARSGLDLRVFDAHTGEERAVQSLSGGETFQASLALALAVADSVQHHAGGVHLDALFVDEGFGTLDPHSLELAIDELDRLRAGGRTVGIISHVAALRERIRVGIEVTATTRGSSVRVGDIAAA